MKSQKSYYDCYKPNHTNNTCMQCNNMKTNSKDKSNNHCTYVKQSKFKESCPCKKCEPQKKPECTIATNCAFQEVSPAILPMPFPEVQVKCSNLYYAELLSYDYCGIDSELTAIMQYVNHEILLAHSDCQAAKILLAIAQAEMIHLQKLGELIVLLGGKLNFSAYKNGCGKLWTPNSANFVTDYNEIIRANIKGEYAAIKQYESHIQRIKDSYITDMLKRIVKDEKYHISLLKDLLKNECK